MGWTDAVAEHHWTAQQQKVLTQRRCRLGHGANAPMPTDATPLREDREGRV